MSGFFKKLTESRPFIIAEMSGNHNGSLDRALAIVDAVAEAGADAVKLQTYTAETMTLDIDAPGFRIENAASPWNGSKLYDLYDRAHTPWEWHAAIFQRARERDLICFSSPFDASAVDFLEDLDAPLYKVASFECIDLPLIRRIAATGKPMIISTGMASVAEIDEALVTARQAGCEDVMILKCTSNYPATPDSSNLATIPSMMETFRVPVGLSDHTLGIGAAVAAVALGAVAIEKHVTLDRSDGGVDSGFSLEPSELRMLVTESAVAMQSVGRVKYGPTPSEVASLEFRRSLYVVEDLNAGDVLTTKNVRAIRPGYGLAPKYLDIVIGKCVNQQVKKGSPLSWNVIG